MNLNDCTRRTVAVAKVLEHAREIGLPEPFSVSITDFETTLGVMSPEELGDWARWLEAPPTVSSSSDGLLRVTRVEGLALEEPITVWRIARQEETPC